MILDLGITEFIRRQLPHHKRQTNRIKVHTWLLGQISSIWDAFLPWRADMIWQARATGQKLSLVALLNKFVENAGGNINIMELEDNGLMLSTLAENTDSVMLSTESEATDEVEIPMAGELTTDLPYDFIVTAPNSANLGTLNTILERYVIAGKYYTIQQF